MRSIQWNILGLSLCVAATSQAGLVWSLSAPVVDGADISNFSGATADINNVNSGNDEGTYVAGDRSAVGQTFTTGGNLLGYVLNAITVQQVQYTADVTFWSVDAGWGAGNPFSVSVGVKNGTTSYTPMVTEQMTTVVSGIPAFDVPGTQNGQGIGAFATFTLASPLTLLPNTTYGFTIDTPGPFFETNGNGTTSNNYAGGEAFGVEGPTITDFIGDHVFHLDMTSAVPEPASALLLGSGLLALWARRRLRS